MTFSEVNHKLDVSGHKCPLPVLRLRRMMENVGAGERIELIATDPMTLIDVPNYCREAGHSIENINESPEYILYTIKKG